MNHFRPDLKRELQHLSRDYATRQARARESRALQLRQRQVCEPCTFLSKGKPPDSNETVLIEMDSFEGIGRTGNYIIAATRAAYYAHSCGAVLILPHQDALGSAFELSSAANVLDFRDGNGDSPRCQSMQENAGFFWNLKFKPANHAGPSNRHSPKYPSHEVQQAIDVCLRHYLGFCDEAHCSGLEDNFSRDTVVVHLRQGDVFPTPQDCLAFQNTSFLEHHRSIWAGAAKYGQPPLSFYFSIFRSVRAKRVIIVGDHSNKGPVWQFFEMASRYETTAYSVQLVSSSVLDDIRLMTCSHTLVASRSTLVHVLRLGFSRRLYASECISPASSRTEAFQVGVSEEFEKYYTQHENLKDEWVSSLLSTGPHEPLECTISPGWRKYFDLGPDKYSITDQS